MIIRRHLAYKKSIGTENVKCRIETQTINPQKSILPNSLDIALAFTIFFLHVYPVLLLLLQLSLHVRVWTTAP
jgi:hypothetical protein